MRRNIRNRNITFRHEDGCLVRTVSGPDGRTYVHRCCLAVFERVAWVLQNAPAQGRGLAIGEIGRAEDLPHTQVDVALAFLHERGIVDRRHRRSYPASQSVHLDAMVEWHALREEPSGTTPATSASRCQRCRATGMPLIMSRFNTEMICEACETREKAHPQHAAAAQAERDAVRCGDMNFSGVGKPADL